MNYSIVLLLISIVAMCAWAQEESLFFSDSRRYETREHDFQKRGTHRANYCPEEKDGSLCYPWCKSGYKGCKKGYTDTGALCSKWSRTYSKKSYGRGAGKPLGCAPGNEHPTVDMCFDSCREGYRVSYEYPDYCCRTSTVYN